MTLLLWLGIGACRVLYVGAVVPAFIGAVCMAGIELFLYWDERLGDRLRYHRIAVARKRLSKALGQTEDR